MIIVVGIALGQIVGIVISDMIRRLSMGFQISSGALIQKYIASIDMAHFLQGFGRMSLRRSKT